MPYPDVFLVGSPKCGTTALHDHLGQHPEMCVPPAREPFFSGKELHFFGSDLGMRRHTDAEYQGLFTAEGLGLDSSVWYLYSDKAATEIHAANPDARILVMLREPVATMRSLHNQLVFNDEEDIPDFWGALDAAADRRAGRRIPEGMSLPAKCLQYRDVVDWAPQLQRYFDVFGRNRVHVTFMEDYKERPAENFRAIARFLGIDDSFTPTFRRVNESRGVRSRALQRFLGRPPPGLRRLGRALLPRRLYSRIALGLWAANVKVRPNAPLDNHKVAALRRRLEPQVLALEELLEMQSPWPKEATQAS